MPLSVPPAAKWSQYLPIGVFAWIKDYCHQELDDLLSVRVEEDMTDRWAKSVTWRRRLTFQFADGAEHDLYYFPSGLSFIEGYEDVLSPSAWINHFIMGEPISDVACPVYERPDNAFKVFAKILERGDCDPLLQTFAISLLKDKGLQEEEVIPVIRMLSLSPEWTPAQICTAAYHAYLAVGK